MNGTNSSSDGFRRFTRHWPRWNLRLLIFGAIVVTALLLIVRIQTRVGRQMAALEREFGTVQTEDLYIGVHARVRLRELNARLLDFQLNRSAEDRNKFLKESEDLQEWLKRREADLDTSRERELFQKVRAAYDQYLADTKPLIQDPDSPASLPPFTLTYQTVQQKSQPLLNAIEGLISAQQGAFGDFFRTTQATLLSLHRLLTASLLLLLAATLILVVVVYRGMIAPLRRVLSQSQAVIERQEKLASLGTLAAGVAHEIRNPLTAIKFRLFSLKNSLPALADHEDAAVIGAELNRLGRIVKDFLQFARPSDPEVVRLPADRLLREVTDLLGPQLDKTAIRLRLETPNPVWVSADPQQIKQVVINLVQNAAESIGRNGAITLSLHTGTERLDGRHGPAAILSVADTGPGISPEIEKRLFDPFFTTKEEGTGLGLAIAARVVAKHGGLLRYHTHLNHGTTFEIVLPVSDDHDTPTAAH
jgi:signal transduction histidine kinase